MIQLLRFGRKAPALYGFLLPALLLLAGTTAQAQCPVAANCTPGAASNPGAISVGMGIFNVTLGSINSTTIGVADGYKDYSCAGSATLTVGTDHAISVRTNANTDENVRVWLDLNNDGAFDATTELVFSSNSKRLHTGTIRLPLTTTLNARLRLRVAADYFGSPVPGPCTTPVFSQTEDYALTAVTNTAAPTAEFVADQPLTCSGCVQFTDQSQNSPTSWLWNFGDGTTSTLQSPRRCYTTAGTYTVTLTATNAAGSNTRTRTNYVTYNSTVPVAASCAPTTAAQCCGYGITQFTLGTLTKSSAVGSYEDFTCSSRVELTEGNSYAISITTGTANAQDTRVWLDLNNDGVLNATTELLYQALNRVSPTGTISIPGSAVKNQPLRLRVISDFVGGASLPCANPQLGQAEDYTVTVRANTNPPVAAFTSNYVPAACVNPVQFTDQSQNAPTSWLWNFGDGTTSTLQNPSHQYTTSGTYTVALTATNAFGSNTSTRTSYLTVAVPCLQYCASTGQNQNVWLTTVGVTGPALNFSNSSGADPNGYGNYLSRTITLRIGQTYSLTTTAGQGFQRTTSVWIDFNRDGTFATNELLANSASGISSFSSFAIPSQTSLVGFTRMRIVTRLNSNQANPCLQNQLNAETEDYSVEISQGTATAEARTLPALSIFPNPTPDGMLHLRLPDASAAGSYAVTVYNVLGAELQRTQLLLGPARPATLDLTALPRGLYVVRLQGTNGQVAIRRIERQ
ncbi:Por secretion system C-terminal sorting domain-containing protein [Hymenobacter daecheongensis DSM 21074]|uniref:Por secretion system C-terminal sorting domain-containing protein n=1 Tax=Hymenobacter daecheongensis DSM 21074 TaxID=1121955 RepID=A0A1M6EZ37_9BACT|nr:GEVED domain-containing protein [Hymenobacter daecheongensis]SHI90665.1 Por secretion system C-terminal sorting domain-containing protein [Hymenobacter daecheongensis DSM 21074]